ncbi:MAG: 4a-hydroxytetrahydrobiopterin dehydratase [Hyphomonadaceae bacterium]
MSIEMPSRERIAAAEAVKMLRGWRIADGREAIAKTFEFADFNAAIGFITRTALRCEQLNHHPEWSNVYGRVEVTLATHDADGVTGFDVALAAFMDEIAG